MTRMTDGDSDRALQGGLSTHFTPRFLAFSRVGNAKIYAVRKCVFLHSPTRKTLRNATGRNGVLSLAGPLMSSLTALMKKVADRHRDNRPAPPRRGVPPLASESTVVSLSDRVKCLLSFRRPAAHLSKPTGIRFNQASTSYSLFLSDDRWRLMYLSPHWSYGDLMTANAIYRRSLSLRTKRWRFRF